MRSCYIMLLTLCLLMTGCNKYLEKKPDKQLVTPSTLADLQALLDNNNIMNNRKPAAGESSTDNYYLTGDDYDNFYRESSRSLYIWGDDITYDDYPNDWSQCYDVVYNSNLVLENINTVSKDNIDNWNNVKGSALLFRGYSFMSVLFNWALAYDPNTAMNDLGIPLRLSSNFNDASVRSSVEQSYRQVLSDLKASLPLLPAIPASPVRPSKQAAYSLIARCYMAMRKYDSCLLYADSSLQLHHELIDYNTLDSNSNAPIPRFNEEVVMEFGMLQNSNLYYGRVDTSLYNSFSSNDLRKSIFFKSNGDGSYTFKGNYNNSGYYFCGPATDEMYLLRAECFARAGNTEKALSDLNSLLKNRYKTGSFVPIVAATSEAALRMILAERRKELLYRDLRWIDLKRLNKETPFAVTIRRILKGNIYELKPNDLKYALPIPTQVITISGIQQNPR